MDAVRDILTRYHEGMVTSNEAIIQIGSLISLKEISYSVGVGFILDISIEERDKANGTKCAFYRCSCGLWFHALQTIESHTKFMRDRGSNTHRRMED